MIHNENQAFISWESLIVGLFKSISATIFLSTLLLLVFIYRQTKRIALFTENKIKSYLICEQWQL